MSEKGQIVVPKSIRDENGVRTGAAFSVSQTKSGAVVFRPLRRPPKMDLLDHLLAFKGLKISERKHLSPPRM